MTTIERLFLGSFLLLVALAMLLVGPRPALVHGDKGIKA